VTGFGRKPSSEVFIPQSLVLSGMSSSPRSSSSARYHKVNKKEDSRTIVPRNKLYVKKESQLSHPSLQERIKKSDVEASSNIGLKLRSVDRSINYKILAHIFQ